MIIKFLIIFSIFALLSCSEATKPICLEHIKEKAVFVLQNKDQISIDSLQASVDLLFKTDFHCRGFQEDSLISELCHQMGGKLLQNKQFSLARSYYQKANSIRKRIYTDPFHRNLIRGNTMIGSTFIDDTSKVFTAFSRMQMLDSALIYFDLADGPNFVKNLDLFYRNKNQQFIILGEKEEWYAAIAVGQTMFNALQHEKNEDLIDNYLPKVLIHLAIGYRAVGNIKEAITNIELAEKNCLKRNIDEDEKKSIYWTLGSCWYDSLVKCQSADKILTFTKANNYTTKAINTYSISKSEKDKVINLYGNLGEIYRLGKRPNDAIKTLEKGIDLQTSAGLSPTLLAQLQINLGETNYDLGKYDASLKYYHKALQSLSYNELALGDLPAVRKLKGDVNKRLVLLSNISQSNLALHRQSEAVDKKYLLKATECYDSLLALVNFLRGDFASDESKLDLAAKSQVWTHQAFEGYMQLYALAPDSEKRNYLEKAFNLTEQSKSFALLETTRLRNASRFLKEELRKEEQSVLQKIDAASADPSLQESAEKAKREYFFHLKTQAPAYYALKYKGPELAFDSIEQHILAKDQAMIAYFCQDSALYSFFIDYNGVVGVDSVKIKKEDLEVRIQDFMNLLTNPVATNGKIDQSKDASFLKESNALYQLLLGRKWEKSMPKRLIIIPDGVLNRLPFEALLKRNTSDKLNEQMAQGNFLITNFAFSYCFSANILNEMHQHLVPNGLDAKIAVFAPNQSEIDAAKEVNGIQNGSILPVIAYSIENSTKSNFWEAAKKYAYLHVATHGIMASDSDKSYIQFTKTDPKSADSSLVLKELYSRKLNQELITFSACETANGSYKAGEGSMSLARGLAYAGVRSILSSYWKTPTDGKAGIMSLFYQNLSKMPKDMALAEAKRQYLSENANYYPNNWAGFVLIGACDTSPVESPTAMNVWLVLGGIALLGVLLWLKRYRK
jgi:CHAT domain-containing protein